jgi:hypothetical protein
VPRARETLLGAKAPEKSICGMELRPLDTVLIDRELVSQSEDFQLHGVTRLEP